MCMLFRYPICLICSKEIMNFQPVTIFAEKICHKACVDNSSLFELALADMFENLD